MIQQSRSGNRDWLNMLRGSQRVSLLKSFATATLMMQSLIAEPTLIAKSNLILDVKPWDDETDMKDLEKAVRSIVMDGLLWGASKLVPLAYGIHKLQISCVIEDEKVSVDILTENIEGQEDFVSPVNETNAENSKYLFSSQVQSVDIAAFNKI